MHSNLSFVFVTLFPSHRHRSIIVLPRIYPLTFPRSMTRKKGNILSGSSNLGVTLRLCMNSNHFSADFRYVCCLLDSSFFPNIQPRLLLIIIISSETSLFYYPPHLTGFRSFVNSPLFILTSLDSKIKSTHNVSYITRPAFTYPSLLGCHLFHSWSAGRFCPNDS